MTRHAIRHVVVTDGAEIVGILEQADLLSHLADTSSVIARQVERAATRQALKQAGDRIPQFVRSLYDRGVKPSYIARLVTGLDRKIMARLFEQMAARDLLADACPMVMGSEGRGEQLLKTDQGNGVDPARLTKLERGLLQDSLKIVKQFRMMLEHHFNLALVS